MEDLLADARTLGFPATRRLVDDWIGLGLLDHPERRSGGTGGGSNKARFSAEQRNLFRVLASKRHEVKYVSSMCNLPVAFWLWWDDYVPTRQVQVVMKTWAGGRSSKPSRRAVRQQARQLTDFFDDLGASSEQRSQMVEVLTDVGYRGKLGNADALRWALWSVFDPGDDGRVFGSTGATASVEDFVTLIAARIRGMERAREPVPLDELEAARAIYRYTRTQWPRDRPELAQHPVRAADAVLLKQESLQDLFDSVCIDLALILGLRAEANTEGEVED